MELFLPESGLMIWMLIGFLIVLFILAKVGWPMIMGAVNKRNQHISDSLLAAQEANDSLSVCPLPNQCLLHPYLKYMTDLPVYLPQVMIAYQRDGEGRVPLVVSR